MLRIYICEIKLCDQIKLDTITFHFLSFEARPRVKVVSQIRKSPLIRT
jgi:hypothetical protein